MKFLCVDSTNMEGILVTGRAYAGEYAKHLDVVKINHYFVEVDKH